MDLEKCRKLAGEQQVLEEQALGAGIWKVGRSIWLSDLTRDVSGNSLKLTSRNSPRTRRKAVIMTTYQILPCRLPHQITFHSFCDPRGSRSETKGSTGERLNLTSEFINRKAAKRAKPGPPADLSKLGLLRARKAIL